MSSGKPMAMTSPFYRHLRSHILPVRPSQYDITSVCNLKCEGCFFFSGPDYVGHDEVHDLAFVDAFFAGERERGINYAEVAGAEPSLAPRKLAAMARHIPRGVIYTNGTRVIPREIHYRLQVSLWALPEQSRRLRGADIVARQLRNYRNDDRAVFVFTINRLNVDTILAVTQLCADAGVRLTFNHFSPTESYQERLASPDDRRDEYFRFSTQDENLLLGQDDLRRSRDAIDRALDLYPETVVYSRRFNAWIHRPAGLHRTDPATGVAIDCAGRLNGGYRHFHVDLTSADGAKCPTPNIACATCRCYAQSLGTALHRSVKTALRYDGGEEMMDYWRLWCRLFVYDKELERLIGDPDPHDRLPGHGGPVHAAL